MTKYELKLKEVEGLIQKEELHYSKKSEELLQKYYAKRKQLLNLIQPNDDTK
jgi:hypothetical protein